MRSWPLHRQTAGLVTSMRHLNNIVAYMHIYILAYIHTYTYTRCAGNMRAPASVSP